MRRGCKKYRREGERTSNTRRTELLIAPERDMPVAVRNAARRAVRLNPVADRRVARNVVREKPVIRRSFDRRGDRSSFGARSSSLEELAAGLRGAAALLCRPPSGGCRVGPFETVTNDDGDRRRDDAVAAAAALARFALFAGGVGQKAVVPPRIIVHCSRRATSERMNDAAK